VAAVPLVKEGWQAWASAKASGDGAGMSGMAGMPVFGVVAEHMGVWGMALLAASVLAAVGTAVTGFTIALSRLSCSLAEHGVLPGWFGLRTERGIPRSAILFLMAVSIAAACTGRTTIGWVVDVSSVCASIVYAYVSGAAFVQARREGDGLHEAIGLAGTAIGCAFFFFVSMPSVWSIGDLATESYCLFAAWGILGICFFLSVLSRDREGRFGRSALVWLFMLFFIFTASHLWIRQEAHESALGILAQTAEHFHVQQGTPDEAFIGEQVEAFSQHLVRDSALQMSLVALIIAVVFGMYWLMRARWSQVETRRIQAEEASRLKSGFLSSMSHDFRTPMNAVIGFTNLALSKHDVPTIHAYLHKINLSSSHMLSLINNVLEMSQLEGGRVELHLSPVNIPELMRAFHVMLLGQVAAKRHTVDVNAIGVRHENILCDRLRLSQILINICGNAIKFTPPGGHVEVNIRELDPEGSADEASFEVRVKDNGVGMSKEFLARNFQAFEREGGDAEQKLGGTGLGMAVTMNLIALMQGTVRVESEPGKGTEFILGFRFRTAGEDESQASEPFDASGLKVLVADDDSNACRALIGHLEAMGASAEWTMSGHEAIQRFDEAQSRNAPFDACILEWRMRDMSGVDAAREMAAKAASAGRGVGLVIVTAYDIERVREASEGTGVAAICAKPVFASELRRALAKALGGQSGQAEESGGEDVDFTGRRVLLVDDIEVNREIAAAVLAMNGFEVDEAEDGVQALAKVEQAEAGRYDVVLMDLQMPNMDGFEATRAIRALADRAKAQVPVVALSANSSDEDIQTGREAGMNGHLAKPIDMDKLFALLRQVIGA
ncbi:MAG: amino acid permease, partial [Desulfovibrio sp.]|nr:amino acid permease [Desulfovibrio sp.]